MLRRLPLLVLVVLAFGAIWTARAWAQFSDVPIDHWAYDAVEYLAEEGFVTGYPDGTFQGDRQLTRYEFAMVISRVYNQFLSMVDESGQSEDSEEGEEPEIQEEAVLNMLMEEFQPEIDELRGLIEENTARIETLEGTVGGFDEKINEVNARVDAMDKAFHPYGDLTIRFEGVYPNEGVQEQRPRFMLHYGFTSQITDELTFGARLSSGTENSRQSEFETFNDAFGTDALNIDRAYMTWQPAEYPGFTAWGGKFAPPWQTAPVVWDSDVQVEGLAQHFQWEKFDFTLGELVPAEKGFYIVAQAAGNDLLVDNSRLAVTYHYINSDAWEGLRADMESGKLTNRWDFSRLETPDDYRAIEVYWEWKYEKGEMPFKVQADFLTNLENTARGLEDEAGWQRAAWVSVSLNDLTLANEGDWNIFGEWGRLQPNSVLSWLTDAWRGSGDAEFWAIGWNYRLMKATDFSVSYVSADRISSDKSFEDVLVNISTRFK